MRVMLRRDLFLGGNRYRQNNRGTEIPEELDGKKVVFWKRGVEDDPKVIPLPHDALPYEPGMKIPTGGRSRLTNAGNPRAIALSELAKPFDVQAEALQKSIAGKDSEDQKARAREAAIAESKGDGSGVGTAPTLGHPALAPSPDQPSVADQTGEKPPTALPPATKPGVDSIMADAKAGEGRPDPRTPAAEKAGKGIKPEDIPQPATPKK